MSAEGPRSGCGDEPAGPGGGWFYVSFCSSGFKKLQSNLMKVGQPLTTQGVGFHQKFHFQATEINRGSACVDSVVGPRGGLGEFLSPRASCAKKEKKKSNSR